MLLDVFWNINIVCFEVYSYFMFLFLIFVLVFVRLCLVEGGCIASTLHILSSIDCLPA